MNQALKILSAFLLVSFVSSSIAFAQSAQVTLGALSRTFMVKSQFGTATIFSIDVDQREYWITAKHVLTGAKHGPFGTIVMKEVTLNILSQDASEQKWVPETFSVTDPGADIDIVVLAPKEHILEALSTPMVVDSAGASFGGDCEFLGFPGSIGGAWKIKMAENGKTFWMPFVKHCTISGQFSEPQRFWILDGINNDGFSGGPVVTQTGSSQRIMAVISGYTMEPADVVVLPDSTNSTSTLPKSTPAAADPAAHPHEVAAVNAGFIIAYDIKYAIDAIKANPIGATRPPK